MRMFSSATAVVALSWLTSCGGGFGALGGGGSGSANASGSAGLSSQCSADFGATQAATKLEAFLLATSKFIGSAADVERSVIDTCKDMGETLGIPAAEMNPSGNTPPVRAACDPVSAKIQSEIQHLRVSAQLQVVVAARPPVCEVSVDAYAGCMAECDVEVEPGQVDLQCEGGELRGQCSAECSGRCAVRASGSCQGSCEGTCSAGCQGTCNGVCHGTCSAQGPNGECQGRCDGECQGSCEGGCTGQCQGQCVAEVSGGCEGECRGGCSVEFQEPRCTGVVEPPRANVDCEAACDARFEAEANCRPGELYVDVQGSITDEGRVGRLRNAVQSGLPALMAFNAKLDRMAQAGGEVGRRVADLPGAVRTLGLQAAACATEAAAAIPRAAASVSVSIEVTASVSASAGV